MIERLATTQHQQQIMIPHNVLCLMRFEVKCRLLLLVRKAYPASAISEKYLLYDETLKASRFTTLVVKAIEALTLSITPTSLSFSHLLLEILHELGKSHSFRFLFASKMLLDQTFSLFLQ